MGKHFHQFDVVRYVGNESEGKVVYGEKLCVVKESEYLYTLCLNKNKEPLIIERPNLIMANQEFVNIGEEVETPLGCGTFKKVCDNDGEILNALVNIDGVDHFIEYSKMKQYNPVGCVLADKDFNIYRSIGDVNKKLKCYNLITKEEVWLDSKSLRRAAMTNTGTVLVVNSTGNLVDKSGVVYVMCEECKEYHPISECKQYKSFKYVCNGCIKKNNWKICPHCHNVVSRLYKVQDDGKEISVCVDCRRESYDHCSDCGKYYPKDTLTIVDGKKVCATCLSDTTKYGHCKNCGKYFMVSGENGQLGMCEECYHIFSSYHGNILSYHAPYRLPWLGKDNECHYGVEMEMDGAGESNTNSRKIHEIFEKKVTLMHDGSLDNGFEIISPPATYKAHMENMKWKEGFKEALHMGYLSDKVNTCGLHVHVDRAYFNDSKDVLEDKFAMLFANNIDWIRPFSRRKNYRYCSYEELDKKTSVEEALSNNVSNVKNCTKGRDHGVAINFGNKDTIEIRIFKGTLNYSTFKATMQFMVMFTTFIKYKSLGSLAKVGFKDFLAMARAKKFTEFIVYAGKRGLL